MRLRSNSCCLLLFSVSSTAPLAASLTSSRDWGSSTAASSPGRWARGARCPVPRRDNNKASCRAAAAETSVGASTFASNRRGKYDESLRALALSKSVYASCQLGYLNTVSRSRLARRRRAASTTRTPTSLFASTNSAGTDTRIRPDQTKNQRSNDEKDLEKHNDAVGHAKQSEDEAVQDDADKNKKKFRNFEEMLEQHRETPILVSFEAKWCGPCKLMKKELKIVRDELAESVMVARIDTEKFPSLGARYKVEGLPSVILFVDGEPVHRIEGLEEAAEIIRQVRGFLR